MHPAPLRVPHSPDCLNLVVKRLPVVAVGNRRPDRLDLLDVHRAGLGLRPIWVRLRPFATLEERCASAAECVGGIERRRRDRGRRASRRRCGRSVCALVASARISAPATARSLSPRAMPRRRSSASTSACLEALAPAGEQVRQRRRFGDERQAAGELREVPVDRLGLPAEGVEPVMVEISGGEFGLPIGREAPRPVVEALAGDVDIVAVEDAVDEAGGEIGRGELRGRGADEIEQAKRVFAVVVDRLLAVEILEAIAGQRLRDCRPGRRRRGAGRCRCGCGRG